MWYNPIMKWILGSPLHRVVSKSTMLVTFTGRKSGKQYTIPVNYVREGDVFYVTSYVTASGGEIFVGAFL